MDKENEKTMLALIDIELSLMSVKEGIENRLYKVRTKINELRVDGKKIKCDVCKKLKNTNDLDLVNDTLICRDCE